MSVQTSYSINQTKALPGGIADLNPKDVVSRLVETSAGIPFGRAVGRGTAENQTVIGSANFIGISIRSLDREATNSSGDIQYDQYDTCGVMQRGYIWADCPSGCSPGNAVKYVTATGVLNSGTASAGETQVDGATWETTAAAGEVGLIRLNSLDTTAGS